MLTGFTIIRVEQKVIKLGVIKVKPRTGVIELGFVKKFPRGRRRTLCFLSYRPSLFFFVIKSLVLINHFGIERFASLNLFGLKDLRRAMSNVG